MASSSEFDESSIESLSSLFTNGLNLYNDLNKNEDPTNSPSVQLNVKNAIKTFEKATKLVSYGGIFSRNEGIDEVPTSDLQYFLLPAVLGSLTLKLTTGERKEIIEVAEIYFKDFLKRCNDYGLSDYKFKSGKSDVASSEGEKLVAMVNTRLNKIQRFKQQKELQTKMEELKTNMANEHADEEIKRDYFLTMIKLFIYEAIEELDSIEMEKPILEHMAKVKKDDKPAPKRLPPPLKPIIITKDEVQKAVYGAGYPSLPTMTVQEFYDKRVRDGVFPDPTKKTPDAAMSMQQAALAGKDLNDQETEAEDKEKLIESDDPEYIERMRRMDDYKDEHRRGWGNRMNRS